MSIFEIIMLLCFGAAWPVSIFKSMKARSTGGKSLLFLIVIMLGYAAGITHKLLYSPDVVVWLYALNVTMVLSDAGLWIRNRRFELTASKGVLP